jgi:hypothetical protein
VPTRNHVHHQFDQIQGGIWFGFSGSYDLGEVFPIEVGWQRRSEGDNVGSGAGPRQSGQEQLRKKRWLVIGLDQAVMDDPVG